MQAIKQNGNIALGMLISLVLLAGYPGGGVCPAVGEAGV